MKRTLFSVILLAGTLFGNGCADLNPRLDEKIDNQNGKIDEIRNNQNGVSVELGKLKQSADIQNSQLKEVQEGLLNINASVSRNENSGIQILQGDGALILVFSLVTIGMLLFYFRTRAVKAEKVADIMAAEIAKHKDLTLHENILRRAMGANLEEHIYSLIAKYK